MAINARIKTAIEALSTDTIYLRSIHLAEANYSLPKTLLDKPIGINANAGDITTEISDGSRYTTVNYPIDVWILTKNPSQDDTGEQIDTILDAMELLCHEFFQLMTGIEGSGLVATESYTLTPVINWSDEILSGYQITFELNEALTAYVCP